VRSKERQRDTFKLKLKEDLILNNLNLSCAMYTGQALTLQYNLAADHVIKAAKLQVLQLQGH